MTRVDEEGNVLGGAVRVGETIRGSYRYDSSTPDTNDPPEFGLYEHTSGNAGITVNTKNLVFQTDPNNVSFQIGIGDNNSGQDAYTLRSRNNLPLANGFQVGDISWQLVDSTGTALSSDALPTTAPRLADYQSNILIVIGEKSGNIFDFAAQVTKVS